MTRDADWLLIEDALRIMLQHAPVPGTPVRVPLHQCAGRVLAEAVRAPADQPPLDNSAMDGYAVRAADVRSANAAAPVTLRVVDNIPAGRLPGVAVGAGEAARIMTGAPVPEGADSVIRIEHTGAASADAVVIVNASDAGRNVRRAGEDVRRGDTVLPPGIVIGAPEVGVLAMTGNAEPSVFARPRVAILATGDELVEAHAYVAGTAATHIVNSNSPALAAALEANGCEAQPLGIARDDLADLRRMLERARGADALITTAGASVGDHDLVKDALEELGCRTLFWRVRIRPGSPFSFGVVEREGMAPLPVFGLPGNPVSALVTWHVLVAPVLRRMAGRSAVYPRFRMVRTGEAVRAPVGLVRFMRVRLEAGDDLDTAYLTGPQGSGILTSVARADALLVLPLDVPEIAAGETALALPLREGDAAAASLRMHSNRNRS